MNGSALLRMLGTAIVAAALACGAQADTRPANPGEEGYLHHLGDLINAYRQRHGLEPLTFARELAELATEHSSEMSTRRQLSHDGFGERLRQSRSRICVENVGWNFPTAEGLLEGWRRSPGHHRNLLDPSISRMGLAASARYVTFFACR